MSATTLNLSYKFLSTQIFTLFFVIVSFCTAGFADEYELFRFSWNLINELNKDVAPTSNVVMDAQTAHEEFMKTLERYGLGNISEIQNAWEQALGKERYNDPYYKRMLTIAIDITLAKYVPYPPKDSE